MCGRVLGGPRCLLAKVSGSGEPQNLGPYGVSVSGGPTSSGPWWAQVPREPRCPPREPKRPGPRWPQTPRFGGPKCPGLVVPGTDGLPPCPQWTHTFLLIDTAGLQGYELFFKTRELKKKWLEQFEMAL